MYDMHPSDVLDALAHMSTEDLSLFFNALDDGMRIEWDCSLFSDTALRLGPREFQVAVEAAAATARHIENME
jgi:hypothetical protein